MINNGMISKICGNIYAAKTDLIIIFLPGRNFIQTNAQAPKDEIINDKIAVNDATTKLLNIYCGKLRTLNNLI